MIRVLVDGFQGALWIAQRTLMKTDIAQGGDLLAGFMYPVLSG
jgi:hypothetical protein